MIPFSFILLQNPDNKCDSMLTISLPWNIKTLVEKILPVVDKKEPNTT